MQTKLFIGGKWRPASDGGTFPVTDPATEETIAEVASATVDDVIEAVESAHAAGTAWAKRAPRERAEILRRSWELLSKRHEEITEYIIRENGKAMPDARGETAYSLEFFRWYAEEAVRNYGELLTAPSGDKRIVVLQQPIGVSVLVTPWNYPAAMATRKIAPALAAGCPVILKPASDTPLTALLVAEILAEAGVPDGVVNVVPSRRSGEVVNAMLHHPLVRKLSFTGSTEVGRALLKEAADTVLNTSMELGGNAPFLVFDDADIDAAVGGAMIAKMRNGGEACTAANRFYVHERVADEFTDKFSKAMKAMKVGRGLDPDVQLGPMVNKRAIEDIDALVQDATRRGSEVVIGGAPIPGKGFFYPPTVLACVPKDASMLKEEIFGPVLVVIKINSLEQAIRALNNTQYGLSSSLYIRDVNAVFKAIRDIEAGITYINGPTIGAEAHMPFGGVKETGNGHREGGWPVYDFFTEIKTVFVDYSGKLQRAQIDNQ